LPSTYKLVFLLKSIKIDGKQATAKSGHCHRAFGSMERGMGAVLAVQVNPNGPSGKMLIRPVANILCQIINKHLYGYL